LVSVGRRNGGWNGGSYAQGYELSSEAAKVFNNLAALDFNAQITVLRHAVLDMGAQ